MKEPESPRKTGGRKVAVILRLYNRVADCEVNIEIIEKLWRCNDYYIVLVSNGAGEGYKFHADASFNGRLVELESNAGHVEGNSQLLKAGVEHIPEECKYTVILESDTWVLGDGLIDAYINKMETDDKCVWASANWVDKYHSLATDFAIIKTSFLKENIGVVSFGKGSIPECHVFNYLSDNGYRFLEIKEAYPSHLPKIVPFGPQTYGKRRMAFPSVPMVSHHIEYFCNSIELKKEAANRTCGRIVFGDTPTKSGFFLKLYRYYLILFEKILLIAPKSRWFKGRRRN